VRAKTSICIASFSVLSIFLCAGSGLRAQATPSASQLASASLHDSANDLFVTAGKTVLVDCAWPIKRVAIAQSETAEVQATSPTEVMVTGKAAGETSLIIWDARGGRQFFNVTVRAREQVSSDSLEGIRRELRQELPGQALKLSSENGSIFLRGTVKDINSSQRAVKIASTAGKVVNLLNVNVPDSDSQILLKVRFISVDRSKETQLGINLFNSSLGNTLNTISTGQFTPPSTTSSGTSTTSALNLNTFFPGLGGFGATIEALETKIGAQVLAEPNLLAANGKQASFLAGGEYPYPMVQAGSGGSGSSVTIMFKEYGVRLNFIPTITPRGTIRLQVAPEVSALDFSHEVLVGGVEEPAITTRKMQTEVDLADGQSFIIGGLLDNTESETFNKIPFLGDIPVLGRFFQSIQRDKANTELIVIVTPEIVAPIEAGVPLPTLKFPQKFLSPNSDIPMNTPDAKTAANTPAPAPPTMPIEKLMDSLKPETPLVIEGAGGTFGASSSLGGTSAASSTSNQ
jgi:pilus assembly protein CpaC